MKKSISLLGFLIVLTSCKKEVPVDHRIIYEYPDHMTSKIIELGTEKYEEEFDNSYIEIISYFPFEEKIYIGISIQRNTEPVYKYCVENTNQFLKLDSLYLPVINSSPCLFNEIHKEPERLISRVGGGFTLLFEFETYEYVTTAISM